MIRRTFGSWRNVLAGLAIGALASSAALAGTTGSVTLGGTVASTLSIAVAPTATASALPLDGEGSASEHIVKVAALTMGTNNEQGFTLTASSGDIVKSGGTSISYQVTSVDAGGSAPASGDFLVASGSNYTYATSGSGPGNQDLYVKYTPLSLQDPGSYSATINLTVTDN